MQRAPCRSAFRALNRRVNFRITKGPQEIFVIAEDSNTLQSPKKVPSRIQPAESTSEPLKAVKDPFAQEESKSKLSSKTAKESKTPTKTKSISKTKKKSQLTLKKPKAVQDKKSELSGKVARYSVQVKASTRLKDAQNFSAALDKERLKNYILSHRGSDKRVIHRVRLGPFDSRQKAQDGMERYQDRFPKSGGCFIIKVSVKEAKNAQ